MSAGYTLTVKSKRGRIQPKHDALDKISRAHVSWLLACGFSNKAIRNEAHVTDAQIAKVVRRTGLKRRDYRDGTSPVAEFVLSRAKQTAMNYAQPKLMPWELSLKKETPIRQNGLLRRIA